MEQEERRQQHCDCRYVMYYVCQTLSCSFFAVVEHSSVFGLNVSLHVHDM